MGFWVCEVGAFCFGFGGLCLCTNLGWFAVLWVVL